MEVKTIGRLDTPTIFDYQVLSKVASENRKTFRANQPFPHIVLEDFVSDETLDNILNEFPEPGSPYWKLPSNIHTAGKQVADLSGTQFKISTFEPFCRAFFLELNSAPFLNFLEELVSIKGLVGDPYLAEGGFHNSLPGGKLDIHADFSRHDHLRLERRVNLLLYLNREWKDEYEGRLGLYDREVNLGALVSPIAKRCLIFETSNFSYHGFENKIACPEGMTRKSIALYYYAKSRPRRTGTKRHRIVFPKDPNFVWEMSKRG